MTRTKTHDNRQPLCLPITRITCSILLKTTIDTFWKGPHNKNQSRKTLRSQQSRYEKHFCSKVQTLQAVYHRQDIYLYGPHLKTLTTDGISPVNYNQLLQRAYVLCRILKVYQQTLTNEEEGIPNTIAIFSSMAVPVVNEVSLTTANMQPISQSQSTVTEFYATYSSLLEQTKPKNSAYVVKCIGGHE